MKHPDFIVVTGTSAGGLKALMEYVSNFDAQMNAAVFIVMHLSRTAISDFLVIKLQPLTDFKCMIATEGTAIERGHIYIASSNMHLLVQDDHIKLGYGPEENRWKPSIDVLFRSSAASWSNRVIGVILTGMLNDGEAGMKAIKKSYGICIVQDPNEAEYADMPLAILNSQEVDYCLPVAEIGPVLANLTAMPAEEIKPAPSTVITEAEIAARVVIGYKNVEQLGTKSQLACPDCGGGLFVIEEGNAKRYRCHIGHAYTENYLALRQNEVLESTLWVALRIMEERKTLLQKIGREDEKKGFKKSAAIYDGKVAELQVHIEKLREILFSTGIEK